jgi:hypothetical protein
MITASRVSAMIAASSRKASSGDHDARCKSLMDKVS